MARSVVLNGVVEMGVVVVPATAMVATRHTWIGAATIAAALLASIIQSRLRVRAKTERQKHLLASVEMAWNIGVDPTPLLEAMGRLNTEEPSGADAGMPESERPRIHLPHRREAWPGPNGGRARPPVF
jgi:hypothetical protein